MNFIEKQLRKEKKFISPYIIPIILILYIVIKNIRAYLVPHFIIIFIISNIDNIFNPNPLWWKITVFFTHGILILLLIMFKPINVKNKNIGIFLLYLIAMFVIYLFPRHYFMIMYSILLLVYYIIDNV